MAHHKVRFQKGLSETAFEREYGTEEPCRAAILTMRWPNGFVCPGCRGLKHSMVATRDLFQCRAYRRQTSPMAGTIFASTSQPLRTWFRAIYHPTQTGQGISSIELGRRLGVTQTTAWKIKHKAGAVPRRRVLQPFDRRIRPCQPGPPLRRRQCWPALLWRRDRCKVCPRGGGHRPRSGCRAIGLNKIGYS